MEAGDRAAGDGDEQEREQGAFPHRAGAVDELGDRRHFQLRVEDHDADRQPDDHADFQEGGGSRAAPGSATPAAGRR